MARILELEDDIQTISDKVLRKEVELDRYGYLPKASTPSPCFRWAYLLSVPLVSLALHNLIQGVLVTGSFFLPALTHLSKCYSLFLIFRKISCIYCMAEAKQN